MNANNLSLYFNAQALIAESAGMQSANTSAQMQGETLPYDEQDFARISSELNALAGHITSD